MVEIKYNYEETAEALKKIADTTQKISRHDLMLLLAGKIAENNKESTNFSAALNNLKNRRLKAMGIEVATINKPSDPGGLVYSIKYTEKKPIVEANASMQALQKDNQRMFVENESLTNEVAKLRVDLEIMKAREIEYKKIITSFYSLAMVH